MAYASITIGPSVIRTLQKNAQARQAFSFLANIPKKQVQSCRSCGGSGKRWEPDWNAAYRKIWELPSEKKLLLKEILKTARIVVSYYDANKQRYTQKF